MAVPVASPHTLPAAYAGLGNPRPFIPVPPKRSTEFRFQEFLDEAANAGPHPSFQRIEPIVPKEKRSFGRFRRRFCDIRFAELSCSHPEWIVSEVSVALCCVGVRVSEQPPDNLEAQSAGHKVRGVCVSVVVATVVFYSGFTHRGGPESLYISQRFPRRSPGEKMGLVLSALREN
jgi:hypothetical protein